MSRPAAVLACLLLAAMAGLSLGAQASGGPLRIEAEDHAHAEGCGSLEGGAAEQAHEDASGYAVAGTTEKVQPTGCWLDFPQQSFGHPDGRFTCWQVREDVADWDGVAPVSYNLSVLLQNQRVASVFVGGMPGQGFHAGSFAQSKLVPAGTWDFRIGIAIHEAPPGTRIALDYVEYGTPGAGTCDVADAHEDRGEPVVPCANCTKAEPRERMPTPPTLPVPVEVELLPGARETVTVPGVAEIVYTCGERACGVTGEAAWAPDPALLQPGVPPALLPSGAQAGIAYLEVEPLVAPGVEMPETTVVRFPYDEEALAEGTPEAGLTILYWNGEEWVDLLADVPDDGRVEGATPAGDLQVFAAGIDTVANEVWAEVSHTSLYALARSGQPVLAAGETSLVRSYGEPDSSPVDVDWRWVGAGVLWVAALGVWMAVAAQWRRRQP